MKALWRAARLLKPYRWLVLVGFVAMLFATAASLIQPQFSRLIIDRGIASGRLAVILWLALGMIGFAVLHSLAGFGQGALMARTAQGMAFDLRNQIYAKIQALSFSYHDRAQTGQLMTRATSDVDMVQGFIGHGLLMVSGSIVMMIGSLSG